MRGGVVAVDVKGVAGREVSRHPDGRMAALSNPIVLGA
jgi:hypothetical protein